MTETTRPTRMKTPSIHPFFGLTTMPGMMLMIAKIATSSTMRSLRESFTDSQKAASWGFGFAFLPNLFNHIQSVFETKRPGEGP